MNLPFRTRRPDTVPQVESCLRPLNERKMNGKMTRSAAVSGVAAAADETATGAAIARRRRTKGVTTTVVESQKQPG